MRYETSELPSFSKGLCLRDTKEVILDLKWQAGADGLCSVGSREPRKALEPGRKSYPFKEDWDPVS